jgi:hypothetical protein
VLADGAVVGRIFKVHAAPVGTPWMWTRTMRTAPRRTVMRRPARPRWQHSPRVGGGGDARINRAVQKMQPRND